MIVENFSKISKSASDDVLIKKTKKFISKINLPLEEIIRVLGYF